MQEFYNFCIIFCVPDHLLLKIRPRPNITRGPCLEESWELSQEIETEYLESCNDVVDLRTDKIKMLVNSERLLLLKYLLDQLMMVSQKWLKTKLKQKRRLE